MNYSPTPIDQQFKLIYTKPPPITFRKAPSLRKILTMIKFKDLKEMKGMPSCCHRHTHSTRGARCQFCPRLNMSSRFTSRYTGLSYKIRHRFDCKSRFCVYLVTCVECECQYTGSTVQHMHFRHGGHRQEVREES